MSPTASSDPNAGSAWAEAVTAWCHPSPSLLNSHCSRRLSAAAFRFRSPRRQAAVHSAGTNNHDRASALCLTARDVRGTAARLTHAAHRAVEEQDKSLGNSRECGAALPRCPPSSEFALQIKGVPCFVNRAMAQHKKALSQQQSTALQTGNSQITSPPEQVPRNSQHLSSSTWQCPRPRNLEWSKQLFFFLLFL